MNTSHWPELLAPAGNLEKFRTALLYGAEAVYLGGGALNLRAASSGFTLAELRLAVQEAEAGNARVYYCLNSLPRQADLNEIPQAIEDAAACGVHAFIVADPGVLMLARRLAPHIPLHLSTQANTSNSAAVEFWRDQGVARLNLARELSGPEIAAIRRAVPDVELEMFVHGAMCLAVSGQCLLSAWLNNRPANQGRCTQPCRFEYRGYELMVDEAIRSASSPSSPVPLWAVRQDEDFSSFWAPRDLCLLPYLPWCLEQGLHGLKIEGRTKSAAYVAQVTDVYASALRHMRQMRENTSAAAGLEKGVWMRELVQSSSRPLSSGFFLPGERREFEAGESDPPAPRLLARVVDRAGEEADGAWLVDVKDNWDPAENIELMLPGLRRPLLRSGDYALENHRGERAGLAPCGTRAALHCEREDIVPGIFIRSGGRQ